jgi:hypothetical protein
VAAEELADVQGDVANDVSGSQQEKPDYAKMTVRDTVRHVREELQRRSDTEEKSARAPEEDSQDRRQPSERARDERGRFAPKDGEQPQVDKELKPDDTETTQTGTQKEVTASQAPAATTAPAAPSTWSKEMHPEFAAAPRKVQDYILQRERQMQDGVQQLKNGYAEIDAAIAPYRQMISAYGQTPAQTVTQLFEWNKALAGPYKEEAFKQLAQRFGIDVSKFAPQAPRNPTDNGQQQGLQANLEPFVDGIRQWQQSIEQQLNAERSAAQQREYHKAVLELQTWQASKPHFERVRPVMQELVGMDLMAIRQGLPPRHGIVRPDESIDLDRAYERAIRLDDELSAQVDAERQAERLAQTQAAQAEAAAKKQAAAKEQAERAKRASASLKPGSGTALNGRGTPSSVGESPRDTIRRTLKELRSS